MRKTWGGILNEAGVLLIVYGILRGGSIRVQLNSGITVYDDSIIFLFIIGIVLGITGMVLLLKPDNTAKKKSTPAIQDSTDYRAAKDIREELHKLYKLYKYEAIDKEEYLKQKSELIARLYDEIMNETKNDYLYNFISLIEENAIDRNDLEVIKKIADEKEKLKRLDLEIIKKDYIESSDTFKRLLGEAELRRNSIPLEYLEKYIQYKNFDDVQLMEKYLDTHDESIEMILRQKNIEPLKSYDLAYFESTLNMDRREIIKLYIENKKALLRDVYGR